MLAIGYDELGEKVNKGDLIVNTETKESYNVKIHYGEGTVSLVTVEKPGGGAFLAGLNGRLIKPWKLA